MPVEEGALERLESCLQELKLAFELEEDQELQLVIDLGHEQAKGGFDRQRAQLVEEGRKEERQGTRWIEVAEACSWPGGRQEIELTYLG
jgi:hypothetical protein